MSDDAVAGSVFVTEESRTARAAPSSVLMRFLRPSTWPDWQPEIVSTQGPQQVSEGDVVVGRAEMLGFEVAGHSHTTRITDEIVEQDVIVGVRMRVRFEAHPIASGVEIRHRMEADLPRGPWGRLLSVFLKRRLRRMETKLLDVLKRQVEADPSV